MEYKGASCTELKRLERCKLSKEVEMRLITSPDIRRAEASPSRWAHDTVRGTLQQERAHGPWVSWPGRNVHETLTGPTELNILLLVRPFSMDATPQQSHLNGSLPKAA